MADRKIAAMHKECGKAYGYKCEGCQRRWEREKEAKRHV